MAQLAGGNATIETRIGAVDEQVTIRIQNREVLDKNLVVHFPVPMRNAWDNVMYTCAVMRVFRNEAEVDEWCRLKGIPKGDVRPIEQVWRFAAEWYGRHADANWVKWSTREAAEMFARHGLTSPVWALPDETSRF